MGVGHPGRSRVAREQSEVQVHRAGAGEPRDVVVGGCSDGQVQTPGLSTAVARPLGTPGVLPVFQTPVLSQTKCTSPCEAVVKVTPRCRGDAC